MTTITERPATLSDEKPRRGGSRSVDRRRAVGVRAVLHQQLELSKPAHDLWAQGRLHEELGIPDDNRTRVEIIGGEIVVSPAPFVGHAYIVSTIQEAFLRRKFDSPGFPWRAAQVIGFNLPRVGDGYIPDLIVLAEEEFRSASAADARTLIAKEIGMAVEVTSKWTAIRDREPGSKRGRPTKWNGYAHEGVEFYLLVDRAPNKTRVTLFTDPDPARGVYVSEQHWAFGETVVLPEPFGVEIPTDAWVPWGGEGE
jgi:Putative restriction endonuclease